MELITPAVYALVSYNTRHFPPLTLFHISLTNSLTVEYTQRICVVIYTLHAGHTSPYIYIVTHTLTQCSSYAHPHTGNSINGNPVPLSTTSRKSRAGLHSSKREEEGGGDVGDTGTQEVYKEVNFAEENVVKR